MKYSDSLYEHLILVTNFEFTKPLIKQIDLLWKKQINETGLFRIPGKPVNTWSNDFHVQLFQKATDLIGAIQCLEQSLVFIQKLPYPKTFDKVGISQFSWIRYHYSYFVITYKSLIDIALIFTNTLLEIGIEENKCNFDRITNNKKVKNTDIENTLIELKKKANNYGLIRNQLVHRGLLPDLRCINDSENLDFLWAIGSLGERAKDIIPPKVIRQEYKKEIKGIVKVLEEDISIAHSLVNQLFDCSLPYYANSYEKRGIK